MTKEFYKFAIEDADIKVKYAVVLSAFKVLKEANYLQFTPVTANNIITNYGNHFQDELYENQR